MRNIKLIADTTLEEDAKSIVIGTDLDGNPFELGEIMYYRADIVFDDNVSKTLSVTSNGNSQNSGMISPTNITNITAGTIIVCGILEKKIDNLYNFCQQVRTSELGFAVTSGTAYGGYSQSLLMEAQEDKYPKDLRFLIMGNDTAKFAAGTRIRIWGC